MPTLDYTNYLHVFSSTAPSNLPSGATYGLSFTATKDCYLVGSVAQGSTGGEEIVSINGRAITATPVGTSEFIYLKISARDTVSISHLNSNGKLHVFREKS